MRDKRALSKEPQLTNLDFKFNGNEAMENASLEPFETNLVKEILPTVNFFVNVGANVGYYVCRALKKIIRMCLRLSQ